MQPKLKKAWYKTPIVVRYFQPVASTPSNELQRLNHLHIELWNLVNWLVRGNDIELLLAAMYNRAIY